MEGAFAEASGARMVLVESEGSNMVDIFGIFLLLVVVIFMKLRLGMECP